MTENIQNPEGFDKSEFLETKDEKSELKLEYELKEKPTWYIQGSYVLDKLFDKNYSRDIDVFVEEGSVRPKLRDHNKEFHITEQPKECYFPPLLGSYNTDRYILTKKGITYPKGFSKKPEKLELLPEAIIFLNDVVRGIKIQILYGLNPTKDVLNEWNKELKKFFTPKWMKDLFFKTELVVKEYLQEIIKEETSEEERGKVTEKIEDILGRKLTN